MRRKKAEPRLSIRIRPDGGRRYVEILVWETHKDLVEHWKWQGQPTDGVASCTDWRAWKVPKVGPTRRSPKVAEVSMRVGRIDVMILAHELLHAALAWCRRVPNFDFQALGSDESVTGQEEAVAHLQSVLMVEAIRVLEPRGLLSMKPTIKLWNTPIQVRRR